jgi:hypothetical protein
MIEIFRTQNNNILALIKIAKTFEKATKFENNLSHVLTKLSKTSRRFLRPFQKS